MPFTILLTRILEYSNRAKLVWLSAVTIAGTKKEIISTLPMHITLDFQQKSYDPSKGPLDGTLVSVPKGQQT